MGWEKDCASSVRDLTRVLNKAGQQGVVLLSNMTTSGLKAGGLTADPVHPERAELVELSTKFDDEIGWVKRDIEKVISLCKMKTSERAAMMQQVESMHKEVHELYEDLLKGSLSWGHMERAITQHGLALETSKKVDMLESGIQEVKHMAQEVAINNISEGTGV